MKELVWLIPVVCFVGALLNGVVLRNRVDKKIAGLIAVVCVGLSCLLAFGAVASYVASAEYAAHVPFEKELYTWFDTGAVQVESAGGIRDFSVPLGFMLDPLSCIMVLFVTFVILVRWPSHGAWSLGRSARVAAAGIHSV